MKLHRYFLRYFALGVLVLTFFGLYIVSRDALESANVAMLIGLGAVSVAAAVILSIAASILIHELGQVAAGTCCGFRIYGVRVGPYEWQRRTSGSKIRKVKFTFKVPGQVSAASLTLERQVERFRVLLLCGPITSLAVGFTCLYAWNRVSQNPGVGTSTESLLPFIGRAATLQLGMMSTLIGLFSLVPLGVVSVGSVGVQIWKSLREKQDLRLAITLGMIAVPWMYGQRARDWNADALHVLLQEAEKPPIKSSSLLLAYFRAMDCGDPQSAVGYLLEAMPVVDSAEMSESALRPMVLTEAAYALAFVRGDAAAASEALAKVAEPNLEIYTSYMRAQAAILAAKGKLEEAQDLARKAEVLLIESAGDPMEPNMEFEFEMLRGIVSLRPNA